MLEDDHVDVAFDLRVDECNLGNFYFDGLVAPKLNHSVLTVHDQVQPFSTMRPRLSKGTNCSLGDRKRITRYS